MLLVYTICTEMSRNGVRIFGIIVTMERLRTEVLGKVGETIAIECSVAVAGPTVLGIAGVPGAFIAMLISATTVGVFGLFCQLKVNLLSNSPGLFHSLKRQMGFQGRWKDGRAISF